MAPAVSFGGALVDVARFAPLHPGGGDVFEAEGDLLEGFMDAGHSAAAKRKLVRLAREGNDDASLANLELRLSRPSSDAKLFTKEDASHAHKVLGATHLLYFYALRPLRLDAAPWLWCLLLSSLSLSSLKFRVPLRNPRAVPTISRLFRLHSIVFALRGVACAAANALLPRALAALAARVLVVFLAALLADGATLFLAWQSGDGAWTTTRSMPYGEAIGERRRRLHKLGYTYAQFGALAMCLHESRDPMRPMDSLAAIQGAAFLQALVRKGLLSPRGYHALYSLQLLYVALLGASTDAMTEAATISAVALSLAAFALRLLGLSKYLVLAVAASWAACYELASAWHSE